MSQYWDTPEVDHDLHAAMDSSHNQAMVPVEMEVVETGEVPRKADEEMVN
jgi:hypothetical protein